MSLATISGEEGWQELVQGMRQAFETRPGELLQFGTVARTSAQDLATTMSYMSHLNKVSRRLCLRPSLLIVMVVPLLLSCSGQESASNRSIGNGDVNVHPDPDFSHFGQRLASLPIWRSDRVFSNEERIRYISLAKDMMSLSADEKQQVVRFAVEKIAVQDFSGLGEPESRFPIFFRVMFDMPDQLNADQFIPFKGWSNWEDAYSKKEDLVKPSWPILWSDKSMDFELLALYEGSSGRYDAVAEFNYMMSNFKIRQLCK